MSIASGSSAEVWYKVEQIAGVVPTTTVGGGASTTLAADISPGETTSFEVVSATGIAAGDILKVGTNQNMELIKVKSDYVSGTTITLDPGTWLNFRHSSGEAVIEVTAGGWTKLPSVRTTTPAGQRGNTVDTVLGGGRFPAGSREGNYDFTGVGLTATMSYEGMGLYLLHVLSDNYTSTGDSSGAGASHTLAAPAAVGDTDFQSSADTDISAGDWLQIGTGDTAEVIQVDSGYTTGTTIPLDTTLHPDGLRFAHASGEAVEEIAQGYVDKKIKAGTDLPPGITFLFRNNDTEQFYLLAGNRISSLSINTTPDSNLSEMTIGLNATRGQRLAVDIFGTAADLNHLPTAHWELIPKLDDSAIVTNEFSSLTMDFGNETTPVAVLGSEFSGAIALGEPSLTFTANYPFEDQTYHVAISAGTLRKFTFDWTYVQDLNHKLTFDLLKTRLGGDLMPPVSDKGPVSGTLNGTTEKDDSEDTHVIITIRSPEVVLPL